MISEETKGIIDRLLLEKLSLAGIARALYLFHKIALQLVGIVFVS
jgi:hypothetical protein